MSVGEYISLACYLGAVFVIVYYLFYKKPKKGA